MVCCMLYPAYQANQGQQPFATAALSVICRAVACPVVQDPRPHPQPQQEDQQHARTCQLDVSELHSAAVALLQKHLLSGSISMAASLGNPSAGRHAGVLHMALLP